MLVNRVSLEKFINDLTVIEAVYTLRKLDRMGLIIKSVPCELQKHKFCIVGTISCICNCHLIE